MNKLNHVAFIMDGNGRWGKQKNKGRNFGHLNGVKIVKKLFTLQLNLKFHSSHSMFFPLKTGKDLNPK